MKGLLKFAAAVLIVAAIFYAWRQGKLNLGATEDDPDGKFLGVVDDKPGFGAYEVAVSTLIVGGLWGAAAVMRMIPGAKKIAPIAQGPTGA